VELQLHEFLVMCNKDIYQISEFITVRVRSVGYTVIIKL
jgi:hypothetical protein